MLKRYAAEAMHAVAAGSMYLSGWLRNPEVNAAAGSDLATHPVLLLHGIGHNRSWSWRIQQHLSSVGFDSLSVNYSTFHGGVEQSAEHFKEQLRLYVQRRGPVHVVAHSLGGLVVRETLTDPDDVSMVRSVVTLGSPHKGAPSAGAWAGAIPMLGEKIRQLRPGSDYLQSLDERSSAAGASWVSVGGDVDFIVPDLYARLDNPVYGGEHVSLRGVGHAGLMHDDGALAVICRTLKERD